MSSFQSVTVVGHLGRDPETRYTADGSPVSNFSVAVSEKWRDKNTGEQREETEWFRCVAYKRTAEVASEYLAKGSFVLVTGKFKTRKYQGRDGAEKVTTELQVDTLKMLGQRPGSPDAAAPPPAAARAPARAAAPAPAGPVEDLLDDDIPF